ncbi:hypothetical protein QTO30_06750 [Yoonia sp. GPGPB17]|uniref:hypothetical protein n=1 Tax=Yoonia sp. GPGPB17 TaxID=3026147 RepID=UPI0030BAB6AF
MIVRLSAMLSPIDLVPFAQWQERIAKLDPSNPISRLAPLYLRPDAEQKMLSSANNIQEYDCRLSTRIMNEEGLKYPSDLVSLFDVHVAYMDAEGFWDRT